MKTKRVTRAPRGRARAWEAALLGWSLAGLTPTAAHAQPISLVPLGVHRAGVFDGSAAEIAAYDPVTARLFVVDAGAGVVTLDLGDPAQPRLLSVINAPGANSVAVSRGRVAIAVANAQPTHPGVVQFHRTDGTFLRAVATGATPDMIAFTPDGGRLLCADEGEPSDDYRDDPTGGVTIIDPALGSARRVEFRPSDVRGPVSPRITGPEGTTLARDLEPEFIAISADATTAYVALQENNAVACIDIPSARVRWLAGLGLKSFGQAGFGLDPSDRDAGPAIRPLPVWGLYQPDAIALIEQDGVHYLVTANEGDPRRYGDYTDQARAASLTLDEERYPPDSALMSDDLLGRLHVSRVDGDDDRDGDIDRLVAFGGRSISVWRIEQADPDNPDAPPLTRVFDSGDAFERLAALIDPRLFNADNDRHPSTDRRSDDRGPEPEGLAVGEVDGRRYLFVGLERPGGVAVFDATDPTAPVLIGYENRRDPLAPPTRDDGTPNPAAGDLGPEGLLFIPAEDSPSGRPLLVVCNEVSGTVRVYELR